ncbi:MPN527 family putative ECF transporter permease subunit [Ureaplasma urealyticum]|uniref:YitT family protein n=1 Tax=Ureaplasma urealyticum TaxID=2130 RepID=A0ABD4SK38_UREUR|nr:hypothetical protein [Ureaplasma urealyticum]EDX53856.1 conserved hypothetical protein [Ureaplasma urealyticum serovar 9 str. ATCC 33175]EDX53164.1 conserved hypothetical protein [Ureaplasma urealyticum serovar 12 str. ATCC 33696]EDY74767.1 conserved hypothetical protein [Ureaplasma urealyticum serovar 4 str. ATCC 27816]MCF1348813.1 hypothetical protein [Ureaplasma urealyticum]MDU3864978.1 hypothetical protein [Ureaplasma urealyticum]
MKVDIEKKKTIFKRNHKEKHNIYYSTSKIIKDYTLSAVMLGIGILVAYLSHFIRFNFLAFDFSLFTLVYLIYKVKYRFVYLVTILLSLANLMHGSPSWVGTMILSLNNLFFVSMVIIFKKIFIPKTSKFHLNLCVLVLSSFLTIVFNVIMNGILYTPLYWYTFKITSTLNFLEVQKIYESHPTLFLLNIKSYWLGIIALYTIFNLIKNAIISFISLIILKIFVDQKTITTY